MARQSCWRSATPTSRRPASICAVRRWKSCWRARRTGRRDERSGAAVCGPPLANPFSELLDHRVLVACFARRTQKSQQIGRRYQRKRQAVCGHCVLAVCRQHVERQRVSFQPPDLWNAQRGVDAEPVHGAAADIDFDSEIWGWIAAQVKTTAAGHAVSIGDPETFVGFNAALL